MDESTINLIVQAISFAKAYMEEDEWYNKWPQFEWYEPSMKTDADYDIVELLSYALTLLVEYTDWAPEEEPTTKVLSAEERTAVTRILVNKDMLGVFINLRELRHEAKTGDVKADVFTEMVRDTARVLGLVVDGSVMDNDTGKTSTL